MRSIIVNEFIGNAKMNRYFWTIFIVCLISCAADGYDVTLFAAILPSIMAEWHLSPAQAGMLARWVLAGMVIGALVFTLFADKVGKTKALMIATIGWQPIRPVLSVP